MDDAHDAKFAEMQKYIPFLESMEKRLENCGDEVKTKAAQLTKIKSLKGLLLSKKKKMKYDNLLKCEQVLIKLYSKVEKNDFQSTKSVDFEDTMDTTRLSTKTGSNSNVYSDTTFGAKSFDADELNRCREKLKSITKPIDAEGKDPPTMSTNKNPPSVFRYDKSETTCPNRMTNLYYDPVSESDDNNATSKPRKGLNYDPYFKGSTSFERKNTFLGFEYSSSINYRRRSRSIEPISSRTAMQSSITQPAAKPRKYTRVLKSPERRRSKSHSKSPPKSKQSEKQLPFAQNDGRHLSPYKDKVNLLHGNNKPLESLPNTSPKNEVKLASPQGAGFYNRRSPMTELSRGRRSKSTSKKEINALPRKNYQEDSILPQTSIYGSPRTDKPSLTLPVGAGFYKRRSPKRLSREQKSGSASKKDTYNDKYVSPRTENMHNSPRVASPYFSGFYKHRSPKKLLDEPSFLNFNKVQNEISMSKGFEYDRKKNKKKLEMSSEPDASETEIELLRRIRSQIVSELNATNADKDIGKLLSKKLLRKEKKRKSRAHVDVEEGEICDQYDELYCDLIRPERVTDASERDVLSDDKVSKQKQSILNTSERNILSVVSTQPNVCNRFDELDLLPATSSDTHTQEYDEIQKHNTAYKDINEFLRKPATPQIVAEDAIKADELDDFFCTKLVEIRKKLEANKEAKQKGKTDIKINFLSEKENKDSEIKEKDIPKEENNAFDNREPSWLDIMMNKSQSLETQKSAIEHVDEKTQAIEKPAMVDSASCGVSQIDILTALNSEIMTEKINLPEVAAQSILTKFIKKDISDSTPISLIAESDKKRRISLETYKEKIAPFVVPSIRDESDNSISSQNEYEDHVNVISRALTAKEYERFQSILNSTINENISDPEAKLSLGPANQKLTNVPISKDQVIEDLFDTSKLLPEDLGPQSPDEEFVFCDDDESPVVIPPDAVSSQSCEFLPVAPPNDRIGRANDIDMRISSVLPVSGTFTASFVKPGPESDVDLFHQQFRSPQNKECMPRSSDNAHPVFTSNKDPRKKVNTNSNTTSSYSRGNNVPGRNDTEQALYNSNLPHPYDRNLYTDSVPASPNINTFDQTQEITHFRVNNSNRNSNEHNTSNFISKMPMHDRGFFSNFQNKDLDLQSNNASLFGDHARGLKSKSSTSWRRGDNPEVHGDRFTPSGNRYAGQRESHSIRNYTDHGDGYSPIADNIFYNHDNTRTKYSSDRNRSGDGQFGMTNTSGHGICDRSNVSHYSDTERFGGKYIPGVMNTVDTVVDNMRRNEVQASNIGRNLGQFDYECSQGAGVLGSFDRGRSVGRFENNFTDRRTVGRERSSGRDFKRGLSVGPLNREPSVGRSLNQESSAGRSLYREPSVGRVFDQKPSVGRTFNREPSVGRVLYREPCIGPTINREPDVGPLIREHSIGRTFNQEINVGRTFHREQSMGRAINRAQSVGRALTREPSVERTFPRDQSVGRNFNREQSIAQSFNREPSLGRLTREPSVERTFTRELSVGRNFIREQSIGRSLNREPSVGRTFTREQSVGRNFIREQSIGRSLNREPSVGRTFTREQSVGRNFIREQSIGRSLNREPSVGRTFNRELSVGRTFTREPSVGRNLNREPIVVRSFNREPSIGRVFNREPSVGRVFNREPSVGRSLKREPSSGRTMDREPSLGRSSNLDFSSRQSFKRFGQSVNREPSSGQLLTQERSVGRSTKREPSVGRTLHREPSVGKPSNKSSCFSQINNTDNGRERNSERTLERGRSTSRNESNDTRRRDRRSPAGRGKAKFDKSQDLRSRRELYDQQKSSYPKEKYSRDPRLARERGRETNMDKNRRHTDFRTVNRHSKSPKGFVYTNDNLAKGFSGQSGISNYKIPKIKRETIPVPESTDSLIDKNKSVITLNEVVDKPASTLDSIKDVDMRVLSSQEPIERLASEVNIECGNKPIEESTEPDNMRLFESDTFVENVSEPCEKIDESLPKHKTTLKSSTCNELRHTGEIIKECDPSLLDMNNRPLGKNIANEQVQSSMKRTQTIIKNDMNQNSAEEKCLLETLQEKQNDIKTDRLPEKTQWESENKKQIIESLLETTSQETTKKSTDLKTVPNPGKQNMNIAATDISRVKDLEESKINRSVDKIFEVKNVNTNENNFIADIPLVENDKNKYVEVTNSVTAEAESTNHVKMSEDTSNALPDSTIQFSNETDRTEASSGEIPDSTNNVGSETKSSDAHVTLERSNYQTGSKEAQETTETRANDSCTPIDALGSILSILTDKSKIREILNLLGENSSTSAKIKRKLAKLTELESDDDEEETSDHITDSLPQHSKLVHTKSTHQNQASGTLPPKHQDPVLDTPPQNNQNLVSDTLPQIPEDCALKINLGHIDQNLKNLDSDPKLEQALDLEPKLISKSAKIVTTEEVPDEESREENFATNRTKKEMTKTKSRGPKTNVSKKIIVKKRITRQSVAIKGNNVLKSQNIKKSTFVGKLSKGAKPKKKRLDELQKLQVDIREMFISDDVLSATGIRNCRINKLTDTIDTAAMKKDTVPSTCTPPLQKPTKSNKKLKKNFPKNNEQCNTSDKKVENKKTPFVVIKGINPDVYKKANKANFESAGTSSYLNVKSLDKITKTRKKPGPKPKTKPITTINNTLLKQNEKANDNPESTGSEISILASSSITTTNLSEKQVVLRPGPKSKKLLCLQNMLQQNQDTIAVDEIQDIILGLRDNSNQTQKYPEQPGSTDSEDEALSTLASRRTKDNDVISAVDMSEDPIQITQQPEQPASGIKLVDENYCFDSLNSEYDCKLCKYNGDKIVHHYKDCHPHDEILISRIRPALVKDAIQQSRILDHENVSTSKTNNTFTRLQCRFCLENFCNITLETFFWHVVTAHTGEYNYDCLLCTDDMVEEGECKQASLDIPQPPDHSAKYLMGYVCGLCSFTQISEKNVKDHITVYHERHGIEIHAINLCNVSTTPEQGPKTSEPLPVKNLQKKNKLRWEQRVNSSNTVSKDDEVLSVDDVSSLASLSSERDSAKNNALEAPTTKVNVGHLSSPMVSSHDGVTIKTELQKESFRGGNSNKNDITSRTGTRQKIINQLTSSTTAVAEKSDGDMTIKIGSIGIRKLPDGVIEYCCDVSKCLFRSTLLITFSSHLLNEHETNQWNGDCAVCKHNVKGVDGRYLLTEELNHLVHAHMDDIDPQSLEARINDIEPLTHACVDVQAGGPAKLNDNDNSSENNLQKQTSTHRKYINVRPFSDLAENRANIFATEISSIQRKSSSKEYANTDSDCEAGVILQREECQKDKEIHVEVEAENDSLSIPRIQDVVSLNSAESGSVGRTSPLASIASSWLEEDKSNENSTLRNIGDNVVSEQQSAEVSSEIICGSLETPTSSEKEVENTATNVTTWKPPSNTDAAAHPVFAAKSPKVVRKMMVAKKQVHPFKCGGRFCSFTTHDTSAFSAHLSAHQGTAPGVRCCVYCSFEAPGEVRALMQHVFSEHAHCQFACVYCPYVSTSSILVEMHRTGAHSEKAPAVLRLHAPHANVLTASSRGALSRQEAVLPYICRQRAACKFQCLTSAQFVSHLAEHKHARLKCSKCPSSFARTSHLIRHLRQHGLCLYQCTYCVFGADAELDMLKHIAKDHPMRRAQAYLRHVSSNSVGSDQVGLPLVNMEKKFNGKIQICESKYTEDPIAEAEAADKLQFEYETKIATEFLTNQSKEKDDSINIEMDIIQPAGEMLTEMPRISFVTSIANNNSNGSIPSVSRLPQTIGKTTETSESSVHLQEHMSAQQDRSLSNTRPKKIKNIKKTPTLKINNTSKSSSNTRNESIICLDSDGEDNSEVNITEVDPIALETVALETRLQVVKPQVLEQNVIESSEPVHNSKPSIITLSDDETHTHVPTSDILLSNAWTSNVLENRSDLPSASNQVLTKNKMIVDSTSLFSCSKCGMSTRAAYNFFMHITKCYFEITTSITCYHCKTIVADGHELIVHLIEHHSDSKLYKCGVCQYIEWTEARFLNHMKSAHSANSDIPIDSDSQIMVIGPKRRRKPGPKPGPKIKPKSKVKTLSKLAIYGMSDLPRTPIVNFSMYCAKCNFGTKVTSNMARHVQYHESQLPVASSEPVNPVPHLESNEKHFDKMTNLAASSNMGRATEKSLLKERARPVSVRSHNLNPSNYPQYVLDHERYACGAIGCTYLSLNEDMLKYHWETLHGQETNFKCPHCPADQQLNIDKPLTSTHIAAHLEMHNSRMYVCSCCRYYHCHKNYVERHLADKHLPAERATLQCLREPPGLASSTDDAAKGAPTMDLKPWCCGFCSFKTMLRADIIEHCNKVHNIRSQYKCGSCSFNHANEQNIRKHQSLFHAGSLALKLITVYFKANRPSTEEIDGSPSWWKQRKRGSTDEPASSSKKFKLSEYNAFKSTESGSMQDANNAVNLDLVKEEPPENMDAIQVCDKSLTSANAEQDPEIATYTFVCPLCTTYKISDVEAMKSHLYEELNYRKWGCNVCSYKSFERDRLVEHIMVEHGVVQEPKSLPEDKRIEQWISSVISTQQNHTKTSEKNKTIVYLMRILPGKDNTNNETQNVTDMSSYNRSTSDRKSKQGRKNKSLENPVKISSADAQTLMNATLFRFPKVDILPRNPVNKTRTEQRTQSTESQKVDEIKQKSDYCTVTNAPSETTPRVIPAQSSSEELVAIFGSFGESKGYRFVCPKCHYGVDNRDSMRKHLEIELNMHWYECDLCHLKFNSVPMYVKHYTERHNGGKGPNKVSTPRILAQAQEWMDLLIHTQGQSIAGYISTHGPDPAPDCQPVNPSATQSRKRRHSLATGSQSDGDDSSDEERLVINEPSKPQVEQFRTENVSSNQDLTSTTDVSSDDQSSSKHLKIDSQSKAKNYNCPHCYFVTRYSTCLVDHISRHFYDKPFKCGYCDFKNYRKQVKEHIRRVHPKEVPKVIKVQFPDTPLVVDLEQQKNSGQNIIKVCLICEASLLPQQVTSHYNMMHPEAKKVLVPKGDTVYRCNDCALMLQTLDDTTEHFRSAHPRCRLNYMLHRIGGGEPQSYLCNHCSNVFPHLKDLHFHHERSHNNLEVDFADLGPSKTTSESEFECNSPTETVEATDVNMSDPLLCGSADLTKNVIRRVARKSTAKLPPTVRTYAVARKSTTKLPYNIEQLTPFSVYGRTPDKNIGHLTTKMPFYGTLMSFTVEKLKNIINISPAVLVEDIGKKSK